MARMKYCDSMGALYDAKRSKKMCKDLGLQWNEFTRELERTDVVEIEGHYKLILKVLYSKANTNVSRKRERENSHEVDQRKLRKVLKGKNVVKEDHALVLLSDPRNNKSTEKRIVHVDVARSGEKDNVQSKKNLKKLVKEKTAVKTDHEANTKAVVLRAKEYKLAKKPIDVKKANKGKNVVLRAKEYRFDKKVVKGKNVFMRAKEYRFDKKVVKGKNVVDEDDEQKPVIQICNEYLHKKGGLRNKRLTQNQSKRIDQGRSVTIETVDRQRKSKKVVERENGLSDRNGIHRKSKKVSAAECSKRRNMKNDENEENEGGDETDPEVQILESAKFFEEGDLRYFVPSTIDKDSNLYNSNVRTEYREKVLEVLRKPFDKEEYKEHRKEVKVGSYLKFHPDLTRKLKKNRYKQKKCLNIYRGFFFWLQNLTNIEAFKPWNDKECLAVDPGSG